MADINRWAMLTDAGAAPVGAGPLAASPLEWQTVTPAGARFAPSLS